MSESLNWVAIIPARAGSKRLPKKNLLKLGGLSLIEMTVKKAVSTNIFKEVIISSDSEEMILQAKKMGAITYGGLRKKELSKDTTSTIEVVKDLILMDECKTIEGFTLLQCTCPFTSSETIKSVTYKAFNESSSCITTRRLEHTYLEWLLTENEGRLFNVNQNHMEKNQNIRSQDATPVLSPTGNAYASSKKYFLENNSFLGPNTFSHLITSEKEFIDIDTSEDYARCKQYILEAGGI